MPPVAVYSSGELVRQLFGRDRRLVFMDDLPPSQGTIGSSLLEGIDHAGLVARIRAWGPVLDRWSDRGEDRELLIREMATRTRNWEHSLVRHGCKYALFHTSVAHHLDTLCFEMACRSQRIPQVFLYSVGLSGRLLPLVQVDGIEDRRPIGAQVSDYDHSAQIAQLSKAPWQVRLATWQGLEWRPNIARAKLTARRGRSSLARARHRWFHLRDSSADLGGFRLSSDLRSVQRQREALLALASHVERDRRYAADPSRCRVVLFAHYQPEATSFPEGGSLANHVDLVEELRRLGLRDTVSYREHPAIGAYLVGSEPSRVGIARSPEYYDRLSQLGCEFSLNAGEPASELDTSTWIPLTLTGSIAIERSLLGLPTGVAGYPWFAGLPGAVAPIDVVNGAESLEFARSRESVRDAAKDFLSARLRGTTLTNVPGIGTGLPNNEADAVRAFAAELDCLIAWLHERS